MASPLTAGCVLTDGGRFRPMVLEAHRGIFFGGDRADTADHALLLAQAAIIHNRFREWHYHKLEGGSE